ncbi:hypothetical protein BH23BAC3_BH23BAC3_14160 [soil metagenome]
MRSDRSYVFKSILALAVIFLSGWGSISTAQSGFDTQIELRSVGVSVGNYSPSFDYFDQTFWDFDGGTALGIESELSIMPVFGIKAGFSYFSTSSSVNRLEIEGEETLTYTLTPITIGAVARYDFPEFTISFSPGIDFLPCEFHL